MMGERLMKIRLTCGGDQQIRWSPVITEKEIGKRQNHARFLLIGRSGGSDRTLPPNVRSIPERSNFSGIATGGP